MISSTLTEGLIYGIMVLGVFSTFRVLNFCDMTVDGSFPLGACVLAACLLAKIPLPAAFCLVFFSGILAGLVTSAIYTKLKIPDLLAGILTMTMLYSVNLRVMKVANVSFLKLPTLFSRITDFTYDNFPFMQPEWGVLFFMIFFVLILKILMDVFYNTHQGRTMGAHR
jgi:putative ABC transport system permease protein